MALLAGTIILTDIRLLGFGLRRLTPAGVAASVAPWTRAGLVILLTTGPVMFSSDVSRYAANPAFRVKMALVMAALLFHFTIHRRAVAAGKGRFAAILSMLLWSCVVLGGRAIADFDI
jgi:hypothetical protein